MTEPRSATSYVIEVAVAVAVLYFVFNASSWSALTWAAFCVFAVAVVVVEVLRDSERMSTEAYRQFRSGVATLYVLLLFVAAVWHGSLVILGFAVLTGFMWLDDRRADRQAKRAAGSIPEMRWRPFWRRHSWRGWQRLWALTSVLWTLVVVSHALDGGVGPSISPLATWAIPPLSLYALGWTIAWVRRGFSG